MIAGAARMGVAPARWPSASAAVCGGMAGGVFLGALMLMVARLGAIPVLASAGLCLSALILLLSPWAALGLGVVVLYSNVVVMFAGTPVYAAVGVSSALLLAIPVLHRALIYREPLRLDTAIVLMVLFLAAMLLSALGATDISVAFREIVQYATEGLVIAWCLANAVRGHRDLRIVMAAAVLTCAALSVLTLYQAGSGRYQQQFHGMAQRQLPVVRPPSDDDEPAVVVDDDELETADRAAGPIGDPNRYAQILLMVCPWALFFTRHGRTRPARLASGGAAVLMLGAVVLTYSRGAFMTVTLMVGCLALWRYVRPIRLLAAAGMLALVVMLVAPNYAERVASIASVGTLGDQQAAATPDGAIRGRATEMLAALAAFLDHPWFGVGPGQYALFYSERYQLIPEISFRHLPRPREAHDLFLSVAAESGVIGLFLFLSILMTLFVGLLRARRFWAGRSAPHADLAAAFALSLVAYLGTGLFLHLSYERYLWFLVGTVAAASHLLWRDQFRPRTADVR